MKHNSRARRLGFCAALLFSFSVHAAEAGLDLLNPKSLTGTVYADAGLKQILFTFRRMATNYGSGIKVEREFNLPDGTLAAREHVEYENGKLKFFALEELQSGAKGSVVVQTEDGGAKITFKYVQGGTKKSDSEKFQNSILVSDMVGPFIAAHWDALTNGATVKCRLVAVSRAETVGFKFFKERDATWRGKPVVMITLQPSSIIIAHLVAPLHFIVEQDGRHHVLQYSGRTTPSIQRNGKWEDLDAVTVFDWK